VAFATDLAYWKWTRLKTLLPGFLLDVFELLLFRHRYMGTLVPEKGKYGDHVIWSHDLVMYIQARSELDVPASKES
jgi:hypothetical protein